MYRKKRQPEDPLSQHTNGSLKAVLRLRLLDECTPGPLQTHQPVNG